MKLIPLTQGKFAKVDDADFEWLGLFNWTARRHDNLWYAITNVLGEGGTRKTGVGMHKLILTQVKRIDHRDGDGLNNQRGNLRAATGSQNIINSRKSKRNTSGFRGVCKFKDRRGWVAQAAGNYLGVFETAERAAKVYDAFVANKFGEFARLNFPQTKEVYAT